MARPLSPLPLMPCGLDGVVRDPSVFATTTALRAGVPRHRLRRSDLTSAGPALWRRTDREEVFLDRLRAFQDLHPSAAFSHTTALAVLGVDLPGRWARDPTLHLMHPSHHPVDSRRPDVAHHWRCADTPTRVLEGVRVTATAYAFVDMAALGASLEELAVIGDSALQDHREPDRRRNRRAGVVPLEVLRTGVMQRVGARGVVRAREALGLLRVGSDSPQETRLRLRLCAAGLPEPEVNPRIPLATGQRLRVDLVWAAAKVAVEYDGDQHRTDRRQWREDRERDASLRAEGWTVIRVTADVFHPPHWELFLGQLRRALTGRASS